MHQTLLSTQILHVDRLTTIAIHHLFTLSQILPAAY